MYSSSKNGVKIVFRTTNKIGEIFILKISKHDKLFFETANICFTSLANFANSSLSEIQKDLEELCKRLQQENDQLKAELKKFEKQEKPEKGLAKAIVATKAVKSAKDKDDDLEKLEKENKQLKAEIEKLEKAKPEKKAEQEKELVKV